MIGPKVELELRRVTKISDGAGSFVMAWSGLQRIKGTLCNITGDERLSADKLTVMQTQNFYIDYPIGVILREEDIFHWKGRFFEIAYINPIGANQNNRLKITLREETLGGEGILAAGGDDVIDSYLNYRRIVPQHFQDMLAADIEGIHSAITGTGAEQEITASITGPDYARNISITVTNVATPSGNVLITGIIRGVADTENIAIIAGSTAYGNKAFDTVTMITIPAGVSASDTVKVGFSDKIGLTSKLKSISSIYKKKVNHDDKTSEVSGKVNLTYNTLDCATISANQDMELRYVKE